ncbi:hypothetical protein MaudCBS49596_007451 [Microsporum audouinii]
MSFRCGLFFGLSPQTNAYSTIVNFNTGSGYKEEASPQYCAIMSAFHYLDLSGRRRLGAIDPYERSYLSDEPKDTVTTIIAPEYTSTPMVRSSTLSFSDSSVSTLSSDLKSEVQLMLREDGQFRFQQNPQELLQSDGENGDDEFSDGTDTDSFGSVDEQQGGVDISHLSTLPSPAEAHVDHPVAKKCHDENEWEDNDDDEDEDDEDEEGEEDNEDNEDEDENDDEEGFESDASYSDHECSVNGDEIVEDLGLEDEFSFISFSRSVHFAPTLETVIPTETYDWEMEPPTEPLPEMTLQEKIQIALAAKAKSLDPASFALYEDYDDPDEHSRDHLDLDKQLLTAYINGLRTISNHVCKVVLRSRTLPKDSKGIEGVEPDTKIYVNEYLDRISQLLQNFFPNLVDEDKFDDILESTTTAVSFDDEDKVIYRSGFTDARRLIQSALEETLDVEDMYMADDVTRWLASELIEPLCHRAMRLDKY